MYSPYTPRAVYDRIKVRVLEFTDGTEIATAGATADVHVAAQVGTAALRGDVDQLHQFRDAQQALNMNLAEAADAARQHLTRVEQDVQDLQRQMLSPALPPDVCTANDLDALRERIVPALVEARQEAGSATQAVNGIAERMAALEAQLAAALQDVQGARQEAAQARQEAAQARQEVQDQQRFQVELATELAALRHAVPPPSMGSATEPGVWMVDAAQQWRFVTFSELYAEHIKSRVETDFAS